MANARRPTSAGTLRSDDTERRQRAQERVERLSALANPKIARVEPHPPGLLVFRFHHHETHHGTRCGLADNLRVRGVVTSPAGRTVSHRSVGAASPHGPASQIRRPQ